MRSLRQRELRVLKMSFALSLLALPFSFGALMPLSSGGEVLPGQSQTSKAPAASSGCRPPTISFSPASVSGPVVTVSGITSPGGSGCSITSISWTWGDGTTSTSWFPAMHTYAKVGTYSVSATTHQSDGQSSSASESVTVQALSYINMTGQTSCPASVDYTSDFPFSEYYSAYSSSVPGKSSSVASSRTALGASGMSVGVYNGTLEVQVTQGDGLLYNGSLVGEHFDYSVITPGKSFACIDFQSNGDPVVVSSKDPGATVSDMAFNVYDAPIDPSTARLIMYPPQFAVDIVPSDTPVNTGVSFLLVVPKGPLAAPLSLWVAEGFSGPTTANNWWAQLGIGRTWDDNSNASYFYGLGIFFANGTFGGGSQKSPIPVVPGDTYNITMAVSSGTTWESLLNGTVTGTANLQSTYANEGADLGLETLPARGGSVNITNPIQIPIAMEFKVDGKWIQPSGLELGDVGENWWNGNTPNEVGIGLWSVEGSLQDSSLKVDSLVLMNSGSAILDVPIPGNSREPFYGSTPNLPTGTYGPQVVKATVNTQDVSVSSQGTAYVTIVFFNATGRALQVLPAILNGTELFSIPLEAAAVQVYATSDYLSYQGYYQSLQNQTTTTVTSSTTSTTGSTTSATTTSYRTTSSLTMTSTPTHAASTSTMTTMTTSPVTSASSETTSSTTSPTTITTSTVSTTGPTSSYSTASHGGSPDNTLYAAVGVAAVVVVVASVFTLKKRH